jgi:copper chaperone NosL
MRIIFLWVSVFIFTVLSSCSVEPEQVNYGNDQCDFCKMGVVDKAHSAQYVTNKGKQFKFDAIECLIRKASDPAINEADLAFVLVADYNNPGEMVNAKNATFLVSKAIKSPMGAYLSAFSDNGIAVKTKDDVGGKLYTWEEIKSHISK